MSNEPSGLILMLAHANKQALDLTMKTGLAHFWSRSRNELWKKGETSGNIIPIHEIAIDCDEDAVIYFTDIDTENFAACHTGTLSCFSKTLLTALNA